MKFHEFWVHEVKSIFIGGSLSEIKILAGSDVSKADASQNADLAARAIEKRITEGKRLEDYDSVIKEFVVHVIDDDNIVTVNRYGAF